MSFLCFDLVEGIFVGSFFFFWEEKNRLIGGWKLNEKRKGKKFRASFETLQLWSR